MIVELNEEELKEFIKHMNAPATHEEKESFKVAREVFERIGLND